LKHLQEIVSSDAVLARDNVVFTPHVAFNSVEAVERLQAGTIENLRAYARGEPINLVGGA
jgi:D-lactate dehydrogenase